MGDPYSGVLCMYGKKHSQNREKTGNILWLFDALSKFRTVFLQWLQDEGDGEDRHSSNTFPRFSKVLKYFSKIF